MESRSPDWQKARSLYESRASHAVIVKEANVTFAALRKRILRERWKVARTEAKEIVEGQGIQQKSEMLRGAVLAECLEDVQIVQQNPPKNMGQSMRRQELLSKITSNGEKAGCWSNGAPPATMIRLEVLQSARLPDPLPRRVQADEKFCLPDGNGGWRDVSYAEYIAAHPGLENRLLPPVIDVQPLNGEAQPPQADTEAESP